MNKHWHTESWQNWTIYKITQDKGQYYPKRNHKKKLKTIYACEGYDNIQMYIFHEKKNGTMVFFRAYKK